MLIARHCLCFAAAISLRAALPRLNTERFHTEGSRYRRYPAAATTPIAIAFLFSSTALADDPLVCCAPAELEPEVAAPPALLVFVLKFDPESDVVCAVVGEGLACFWVD